RDARGGRRALGRLRRRRDAAQHPLRRDLRAARLARAVARGPRRGGRRAARAGRLRPPRVARAAHGLAPVARPAERHPLASERSPRRGGAPRTRTTRERRARTAHRSVPRIAVRAWSSTVRTVSTVSGLTLPSRA